MPGMEGNFNPKLDLLWGGRGVAARGPLEWDEEGTSATLHVVIMQNTGTAATGRTGHDLPHGVNEFLIAAAVQGEGTLTPGAAIATGLALVYENGVEMYQWSTPVTLESPPAAGITEDLSVSKKVRTPA